MHHVWREFTHHTSTRQQHWPCAAAPPIRNWFPDQQLLLHVSLLLRCCFRHLSTSRFLLLHSLDHTHSNRLPHITNSKTTKWRVLGKSFHGHGLGGNHLHKPCIPILQKLRLFLQLLAWSPIHLRQDLSKLHRDVGGMAIQHWCIPISNLTRVVHDDNLGGEIGRFLGRIVLRVRRNIPSLQVLHRNVLHIEPYVVSGMSLQQRLVVHLYRLHLSGQTSGSECHHHTRLDNTRLHSSHRHSPNASNLVHVLQR